MKKMTIYLLIVLAAVLMLTPISAQEATPEATRPASQETVSLPWWNNRVFYEVFVRSFYDSNGDGIGDLQGLIQKLDYLNDGDPSTTSDLGVTGLWLMPIMESPSYHGYDVTDYRNVETDYGTNDDFKQLIAAAHQRDIAVIVDLVVNHTSIDHPWFKASVAGNPQYRDWYRWDASCPTYLGPWNEKVWIPLAGSCYYAIFWEGMPDLNYENPAVTTEMDDIARYWLDDMGADGFRLDALQHIVEEGTKQANTDSTHVWANAFHQFVNSVKPDALTVGEVQSNSFLSAAYVPDAADLVFDFDLANAMIKSANQGSSGPVASQQKIVNGLYPPSQYAAFLTNHDQPRVMGDLNKSVNKARVAADLLLTQPGVPFIYYGEEIGMNGAKPDERLRTPMQWDSSEGTFGFTTGKPWELPQPDYATVNVEVQTDDSASLLSHYRDLIRLRNTHPALQQGTFTAVKSASSHVYSFLRQSYEETLLVVINLSGDPVSDYGLSLAGGLTGETGTLVEGAGELTQPEVDTNGAFSGYLPLAELAPYSLTVIQFTR